MAAGAKGEGIVIAEPKHLCGSCQFWCEKPTGIGKCTANPVAPVRMIIASSMPLKVRRKYECPWWQKRVTNETI